MRTRSVKILQILIEQTYPIGNEELAQKFQVSSRTIRSNIKEINQFLSRNNLPSIQTVRGKGIKVSLSDEENIKINHLINNIDLDYYSNSDMRILNLILELAFGNIKYIYKKQEEFQVSKSTIDNDMKKVREILTEYHLSLNTQTSEKIEVDGSERAIRVMLFNIINRFVGPVDIYDSTKIQSPMYQILFKIIPFELFEKTFNLYEQYISYDDVMYKNQTILFISIWLTRLKYGYSLRKTGMNIEESRVKNNIDLFVDEIENEHRVFLSEAERSYIRLILETLVSRTVKHTSAWTKGQIITLELIDHVQKELNLQLNSQEELFSGLFKHIVKLTSRLKNNMQIINPLTEEIKNNNPKIFESIKSFQFNIGNVASEKITDDEIAFIAIYFLVSVSQVRQSYNYLYKAVVFCNHGKATGQLLAQMLEENFDIDVVAVLSPTELPLMNKLDIDVAFSTINMNLKAMPLLVVDSLLIKENYDKVEDFLDQNTNRRRRVENSHLDKQTNSLFFENILHLITESNGKITEDVYQKLKDVFKENSLHLDEEAALPKMSNVLKEKHISFNLEANHWNEAITKTAESLLSEKIIDEHYIEAMVEAVKVNGPYIVMGPHIALAHAKPEDGVNEIGVSVSVLKNPVTFGHEENDPVKIIFCIAPIDSYTHINIMKDIFELINDDKKIQKILNSKNIGEFKQELFMI